MEVGLLGPSGRTTLGQSVLTIGRTPGNQLVINDPRVSGHHAEIRPEGQGYYILDLGSTNHTFINEHQLMPNIPRTLNSGDSIRFGTNVVYMYEVNGLPQETRTVSANATVSSNPTQLYNQSAIPADQMQANRQSPPHQYNHQNHQQQPAAKRKKGGLSKMQWIITSIAVPIITALITGGVILHNNTTPSIPQLHTTYTGTSIDLIHNTSFLMSIINLSEDNNTGSFIANMTYGTCTGQVTNGLVSQSGKVTFTYNQQAGSNNCFVVQADFTGQINSAGAITGSWTEPNGNDNGSFTIS